MIRGSENREEEEQKKTREDGYLENFSLLWTRGVIYIVVGVTKWPTRFSRATTSLQQGSTMAAQGRVVVLRWLQESAVVLAVPLIPSLRALHFLEKAPASAPRVIYGRSLHCASVG